MSYSLNTLNTDSVPEASTGLGRFAQEIGLLLGAVTWLFCVLALLSHSLADPAWSTSGTGASLQNWGGRFGALVADLAYYLFGMSVWWAVLVAGRAWLAGLARWLRGQGGAGAVAGPDDAEASGGARVNWELALFWLGLGLLLSASTVLEWIRLHRWDALLPGQSGGVWGTLLGPLAGRWLGVTGSTLLALTLLLASLAVVFRFSWGQAAEWIGQTLDRWFESRRESREAVEDLRIGQQAAREREREEVAYAAEHVHEEPVLLDETPPWESPDEPRAPRAAPAPAPKPVVQIEPTLAEVPVSTRVVKERQKILFAEMPDSKLPPVDLLDPADRMQATVAPETLEMTSRLIEKKLRDFGVEVVVVAAQPGPVITRYEIEPATGVKGSQVVNLAKDLARSLSLVSVRVIETIPGKNLMALELPNAKRQTIKLSEILGSQVYHDAKSMLTMGLGKDIAGHPIVADLAKMPHCLVAGTTGSGKSVGINAMILSLLYKADAKDVRLLLIDPKMLELSVYEGIPHLLCPVVTDMKQAAHGLNWCVGEMEKRYRLMSKVGVRNLAGYNTKLDEAKARGESIANPFSLNPEAPEPLERLPHIVVVIDELADLMMVVGKKIEELIARLAQKARAAGIHLILATQRPSVDVITGLIKANIPTRISFQVSSKIDSRTILDQMGAEALLGMGDMLYMPSGTGYPTRVHGAFVSDDEVHRVVTHLKAQGEPDYIDGVLEGAGGDGEGGGDIFGDGDAGGEKDALYDQAVAIVLQDRKASISYVQRKLKIGYNRAARLLEDMENAGLVSALTSSGQRDILVAPRGD
ncbi:MAG TPA: DNA translocase FtsK 4TM domain-containing protein [Macromonas sp.]|nr:DNA translocase FtsK 4TM domain-containing protein [Macromonas sp.]